MPTRSVSSERREASNNMGMEMMVSTSGAGAGQESGAEEVEEAQEETSFEGGTTWYDEESGASGQESSCESPRRVQDV